MGWTNTASSTITANKVIIEGDNGSVLVYNGAPGPGNLQLAISGADGTDPYGNDYVEVFDIPSRLVIDNAGDILGFNVNGSTLFALVQSQYMVFYSDLGATQGAPIFAFGYSTFTDPFGNVINAGLYVGQTGEPENNPVNGMSLYVDGSGNLKALTQDGNIRTIATV